MINDFTENFKQLIPESIREFTRIIENGLFIGGVKLSSIFSIMYWDGINSAHTQFEFEHHNDNDKFESYIKHGCEEVLIAIRNGSKLNE